MSLEYAKHRGRNKQRPYVMRVRTITALFTAACLLAAPACRVAEPPSRARVAAFTFDSSVRYQTIEGWGGLLANWHWVDGASGPSTPTPNSVEPVLLRELVFDLGLNRFGLNFPAVFIEPANDNDDPRAINPAGFDFSKTEPYIREQLLPLCELLRGRGERFVLYASVILYRPSTGPRGTPRFVVEDPEEYAEFSIAALEYLRGFGLEPDYWVMVNEPDLVRVWTPAQLADRIVRLGRRMRAAGFATRIAAPETVQPAGVSTWLSALAGTPEVRAYLGGISYHSYDYDPTVGERPPAAPRTAVANWGRLLNLPVAQTEQGQAGKKNAAERWNGWHYEQTLDIAENIFADLLYANASAWQLHAVVGWGDIGGKETGGTYISARRDGSGYDKPAQYWAARHFAHWLRPGAVRVGLRGAAGQSPLLAAAFLTPAGRPVVVAINRASTAQELLVNGLPAGSYRVSLTTREQKAAEQSLTPISAGQPLRFTLPAQSLATFYTD